MTNLSLVVLGCHKCDVAFAVTEDFDKRRRSDHKEFYCPKGHVLFYPKPKKIKKTKEKRKVLK